MHVGVIVSDDSEIATLLISYFCFVFTDANLPIVEAQQIFQGDLNDILKELGGP